MTFKQVLSFFLTGATVLSMSATALAADTASDVAEDTGANTVVDGLETALRSAVRRLRTRSTVMPKTGTKSRQRAPRAWASARWPTTRISVRTTIWR